MRTQSSAIQQKALAKPTTTRRKKQKPIHKLLRPKTPANDFERPNGSPRIRARTEGTSTQHKSNNMRHRQQPIPLTCQNFVADADAVTSTAGLLVKNYVAENKKSEQDTTNTQLKAHDRSQDQLVDPFVGTGEDFSNFDTSYEEGQSPRRYSFAVGRRASFIL